MNKVAICVLSVFLGFRVSFTEAQFITFTPSAITIDNKVVQRVISLENSRVKTTRFSLSGDTYNFVSEDNNEFKFIAAGRTYTGNDQWIYLDHKIEHNNKAEQLTLRLSDPDGDIQLELTYIVYSGLPIIRKKIAVKNTSPTEIRVESSDIEYLTANKDFSVENIIYHNYARMKSVGPFLGTAYDPAIIYHYPVTNRGLVLGNEAPGVMKRTSVGTGTGSGVLDMQIGLRHADETYAFREWLRPGEMWESDYTFMSVYKDESYPYRVIDDEINRFTTNCMNTRIARFGSIPMLMYNTWKPFSDHIDEKTVKELADAAAECGIDYFIVDAGWYSEKVKSGKGWMLSSGDFIVDNDKFPAGLTPVYNHIHQKLPGGGLWFSMSAAGKTTDVFKNHPDWFVKDSNGEYVNLHNHDNRIATGCLTTGWYDYIFDHFNRAVKEYKLNYLKVDLAVVLSAYRNDHEDVSGCAATDHEHHKDRNESYLRIYRRTYSLFDDLHRNYPDLYIDCTFELMGAYQLIDYSTVQHAEGNWLSNFYGSFPSFGLDIRHLAWWRSPMMPAASLLIGNANLDDEKAIYYLKCLAGTLPVMLGDLRKIPPNGRKEIKKIITTLKEVEKRHGYMLYRQELFGFGEPREGGWDGWQRINRETGSGGLVGVFRHGSKDTQRRVTINYLNPGQKYEVIDPETGKTVTAASGENLRKNGFDVKIEKEYDGKLFEVKASNYGKF